MPDNFLTGYWDEARLRGQQSTPTLNYTPASAQSIADRAARARAGEGTLDIYRGDGTSSHVTGSQLRASTDPELVRYRQNMIASGVSDPNMIFGPEGGREVSEEEKQYRHAYHNFMRNPNKGVDHNEAIRAFGMWAAAVAAAYALPAAGGAGAAGSGSGLTTLTAAEQAAITAGLGAPGAAGAGIGAGAAGAGAAALPEIVVTGTLGSAGLTAGEAAALGAGAAGAGAAMQSPNINYNGGWSNTADPASAVSNTTFGSNADVLANSGAIGGGAGANSGTGILGSLSGAGSGGVGQSSLWGDLVPLFLDAGASYLQGQGAKDASRAQVAASREAIAEQRRQFDLIMGMLEPQRQLGVSAIGTLNQINGYNTGPNGTRGDPNMGSFYTSPDYNFRRTEGTRDINNSFAARGGALSGNALRGITDFNSNLASGEFNNFYQRRLQEAGLGGAATSQGVNAANYTGANVSNLLSDQGNARASGIINQNNALVGGLNQAGTWYGNWLRNRQLGG
jgi:hypothetical protein